MKELLESKVWQGTKQALLEGLDDRRQKIVETVLENQRKHLMETPAADVTGTGNIGNFQKIVMPMIRRIIPGTIATEIVGVQPMTGPTGLIFSMRYVYKNNATVDASEAPGGNIAVDDEAFGNTSSTAPFASRMRRFYAGGVTPAASGGIYGGTAGVNVGGPFTPAGAFSLASAPLSGEGGDVVDMESFPGRAMGIQVLRQAVEAKTRKLQAKWSIEAMQDLSSQHGLDLEAEITQALSAEIVHEIDNEIVTDLIKLAGTTETFDMAGAFTGTPHYIGDRHAVLGVLINKVANDIAAKTRRGAGNFIIVSPQVVSVLQSAAKSVFAPAVSGSFEGPNNTKLVGTLNGTIKVYSFLFDASFGAVAAGSSVPGGATASSQIVLVGYKGGNGETDAGYFYCPYIPLMTSNTVVDPQTYNNQIAVLTRYGKATFTSTATSLANSADYYGKIVVNNLTFL
jgi:hypothetical protein